MSTSDPPFPPPSSAEQKPEIQKENTPTPGANYTGDGKIKQRRGDFSINMYSIRPII